MHLLAVGIVVVILFSLVLGIVAKRIGLNHPKQLLKL
jgi:hypothetical protein